MMAISQLKDACVGSSEVSEDEVEQESIEVEARVHLEEVENPSE